ncbi:hypothetical protein IW139_000145 [Coemansia sp. RSA 353]|nr:hypothetical protein LPJ58_000627 [Coemansia sp. RSA 1591]KAJ1794750.1 hypothetical protein LPJ67_000523 [Coemansia sp. RSA 1938]KAJ2149076.1 hypothetical protein J3F82_004599 [Coemansia sp. RSA 637]KAJ2168985.1 hypothetical protein GGH15_000945 [Coemansia sp. RSA 562]KAJ2184736.1 hypothetical protein EV181_004225 [Coemansia sp. RSA 532]KAJ2207689.1 hypothetical protein IW145_001284 [Coemansia sp. RSA 521]KAJ2293087.1 hypothetical protein IW141_001429 [Coemansia sp. RSA 355]KAJ2301737.1 h
MLVDSDMFTGTACSRMPTELLLEIFMLLTPYQRTLHACVLTSRRWNHVATPVLWKRPQFSRLSSVELFAASLLTAHRLISPHGERTSPYVRLIETLAFSSLPEPDRNNPHLATLLDTIVNCMAVVSMPTCDASAWDGAQTSALALKRSRSLSRNDDATRPHSAAALPLPEGTEPELSDKHAARSSSGSELLAPQTVDDTQLHYAALSAPVAEMSASAPCYEPSSHSVPAYTSTLRQLDLRFCKGVRNYSLQRLAPKLASLTVLNLAGGLRTDITIAKLAQHMFQLRRISLAWTSNLTDFGVSELVQRCKSVECLDLTYCTQIEDTAMFAIAHNLRNLCALSVAYCAGVTDIGVREVMSACPQLCVLNVAKCLRVTDRMRKSLEQQRIVAQCDSFEPFSIYNFAKKQQAVFPKPS